MVLGLGFYRVVEGFTGFLGCLGLGSSRKVSLCESRVLWPWVREATSEYCASEPPNALRVPKAPRALSPKRPKIQSLKARRPCKAPAAQCPEHRQA